jgi:cobaltochelatase CobN
VAEHRLFERRLGAVELVVHNQDNREHDILDSDDYYQFEGGLAAAVRHISGAQPQIYHNDHSRPETPRIGTLKEEIGRIVRARAANPKWLAGVMRHGYKGACEIAATVDYLFAFAATARVVEDHHFDALYEAYLADDAVRGFIAEANPAALREIADRFQEALERGLWRPASNSVHRQLEDLTAA